MLKGTSNDGSVKLTDLISTVPGLAPGPVLTRSWQDAGVPSGEAGRYDEACRDALASGQVTSFDFHTHGSSFRFYVIPERTPDGEVIGLTGRTEDITGRLHADDELAALAAIVRSSDDAITSKTLDGIVTSWNAAAERLYGYSAGEMIGQSIARLVPHDRVDEFSAVLTRLRRGERLDHYVTERIRKDGRRITISVSTSPLWDDAGQLIGAATIARDIGEWRDVENALQQRDHRFQRLIEQSSDAIALLSPESIILYASPSTERILGYSPEEFVGRNSSEFGDPNGPVPSKEEAERFMRTPGAILTTEVRVRHKNGSWRWIEGTFTNLLHDPVVCAVVANYRDITERRQMESERDAERSRLRQLLDVLPEAVMVIGPDGTFELTNAAATRILGPLSRSKLRKQETEQGTGIRTTRIDGTPMPLAEMPVYRSFHNGETVLGEQLIISPQSRDRDIPCLVSSAPLLDENGAIAGAVTVFQDITVIKQFERSREEFLSSVSHDLKTPLTALLMVIQMTKRRLSRLTAPDAEALIEQQDLAEQAIGRMTGMVDELLDVTRLQLGQPLPIDMHPADIVGLVRSTVEELQRTTNRHTIRLDTAFDVLVQNVDKRRFQRVVGNLLSNAIKYSPNGGGIVVRIEVSPEGDIELAVHDSGLGIPKDAIPNVFKRHFRAANVAGVIEGTGLGLATVREVVERHGGTIIVESNVGRGSTFTVRLPRQEPV